MKEIKLMKKTAIALSLSLLSGLAYAADPAPVTVGTKNLVLHDTAEASLIIPQDLTVYTGIQSDKTSGSIGNGQILYQANVGNGGQTAQTVYLGIGGYKPRTTLNGASQTISLKERSDTGETLQLKIAPNTYFAYEAEDTTNNALVYKYTSGELKPGKETPWLDIVSPMEQTGVTGTFILRSYAYVEFQ